MDAEPNRGRGGGKHQWDKQVSRDKRKGESDAVRAQEGKKEAIEGGLNWPISPQARRLHNGSSLGKKVTLQTGPTGDTGVHVCARVCEHVCMSEREKKMTDTDSEAGREKICVREREQSSVGSTGKLVTSGQTDRLSGFRNKISRELTN